MCTGVVPAFRPLFMEPVLRVLRVLSGEQAFMRPAMKNAGQHPSDVVA